MDLIGFVIVLIIIGVLMWVVNGQLSAYIWPQALKLINVVVLVVVVIWALYFLLNLFGLWSHLGNVGDLRRHN